MAKQGRPGEVKGRGGEREPAGCSAQLETTRRYTQVPTECALCGVGGFSSVVEVTAGPVSLLHWVSPPPGWYLLREARPERGAPLLYGRCPTCMEQLLTLRG